MQAVRGLQLHERPGLAGWLAKARQAEDAAPYQCKGNRFIIAVLIDLFDGLNLMYPIAFCCFGQPSVGTASSVPLRRRFHWFWPRCLW